MKTICFVLAFGLCSFFAQAQGSTTSNDTTEIVIGKKVISMTDGKFEVHNKDDHDDDDSDQDWQMGDDHDHDHDG